MADGDMLTKERVQELLGMPFTHITPNEWLLGLRTAVILYECLEAKNRALPHLPKSTSCLDEKAFISMLEVMEECEDEQIIRLKARFGFAAIAKAAVVELDEYYFIERVGRIADECLGNVLADFRQGRLPKTECSCSRCVAIREGRATSGSDLRD